MSNRQPRNSHKKKGGDSQKRNAAGSGIRRAFTKRGKTQQKDAEPNAGRREAKCPWTFLLERINVREGMVPEC